MSRMTPAKKWLKAATSQMLDASASVKTVRRAFSENLKAQGMQGLQGMQTNDAISRGFCDFNEVTILLAATTLCYSTQGLRTTVWTGA